MTTRISRLTPKKTSTSVTINSSVWPYINLTESEFDQPTNYSLLYAEENSVIEEVGHFDYLTFGGEQENTLTTYYTEGTPFDSTPLYFSTSTSTSDLLKLDDTRLINNKLEFRGTNLVNKSNEDKLEVDQAEGYMEFENKDKECENTEYLDDSDFDEKCDERIINVTPSQSPDLCEKDKGDEHTPLMFSRCSSLGSLSGFEQQSLHDDRSSIVSDFTSEVVSPSELPESPAGPAKKTGRRKTQPSKDKNQIPDESSKRSIFEDDLSVFKEESTPIKFQSIAASSLSSLTIDDDDIEECKVKTEDTKLVNYFSADEEQILDEYIRKGIAKVTKQDIKEVSLFNLQTSENACKSTDSLDDNSDLTAEEEKLLDECIRRGIAKVTRQNINDVTSLSLRATTSKREKTEQKTHDESQKRTAVCQTE